MFTSCTHEEEIATPADSDIIPPVISILKASVTVHGAEEIHIANGALYVGDVLAVSWYDNKTANCKVEIVFNDSPVTSGFAPQQS